MAADFKLGLTQSRPGGVMAPSRTIRTAFVAMPCRDNFAQVPQVSKNVLPDRGYGAAMNSFSLF